MNMNMNMNILSCDFFGRSMSTQVPRYDADRLVLKLVEKVRKETNGGTGYQFDWEVLGEAAGACFNAVPADVAFLNGPLAHGQGPVLRRAPIRRRVIQEDREAVAQRPEDVEGHTEKDENKLSAIEESMKAMSKILEKKVNQQYRSNKEKLQQAYGGDIPADVAKKVKKFGTDIDGCQFLELLNENNGRIAFFWGRFKVLETFCVWGIGR